jgi:Zn-finger nucleic acid-binding protein
VLTCPRDGTALDVVHRADQKFEIDVCKQCSGVWLDSHELAGLCPTASHLPARRDEAILSAVAAGREASGIATCPRCSARPHQLELAGTLIDFCAACGGIWLDRYEVEALLRDPPKEHKEPATNGSPFRQTAAELQATGASRCSACGARADAKNLYARREGFVCTMCWVKDYQDDAQARARRSELFHGIGDMILELLWTPREILGALKDQWFDPRPKAWRADS